MHDAPSNARAERPCRRREPHREHRERERGGGVGVCNTPLRHRPARDHQFAGGAQRSDIAINRAAVHAKRVGEIADGWLGALGQRLGAQAANAAVPLGDLAALGARR